MDCGVSALNAFEQGLQVIGNNIANVNTTGFKGSSTQYGNSFSDILQGAGPSSTVEIGMGANVLAVNQNFAQGQLNSTGVPTDVAISGNGYFTVEDTSSTPNATYATRDGTFSFSNPVSGVSTLQNADGYAVLGTGGKPVTVNSVSATTGATLQSVAIDTAGNVTSTYADGTTATTGQILLTAYSTQNALPSAGNNLYTNLTSAGPSTPAAPGTNGLGVTQAGYLEGSNVDLTQQFSDLITTQRSFEAASRLITVSDTILQDITDLKRS